MPSPKKPPELRQGHPKSKRSADIGLVEAKPPDAVTPAAPVGILKVSKERWEAYWRSAVSSAVDLNADAGLVERWIRSVDEWHRAYRDFRRERVTTGSTGQLVLSPLAKWIRQLEAEIGRCEQQLGLTPMSRLKLGLTANQARLTAEQLNKSLSEDDASSQPEPDAIDAEWEAV